LRELFNRENKKTLYEIEYNLIVTEPFLNIITFDSNISNKKELFKLEIKFDKNFWLNQNQLPLTNELNEFIENIRTYKKDFKIISNF
jgi:hypothetical protein